MIQTKSWQFFGTALAIAVALIVGTHLFGNLERELAAHISHSVCFPLLDRTSACYASAQRLSTHEITALAVSADGQMLATGSHQAVQLWSLQTNKRWRSLRGHHGWITALTFSPDGQRLATGSLDRTIKLWDLAMGHLLYTLHSGRMTCIRFSPDGKTLVAGSRIAQWSDGLTSPGGIQRWDVTTGQRLPTIGSAYAAAIAFNKAGTVLASGLTNTQLWHTETGQLLHTLNSGEVTSLAFSPDDQTLISASSRTKFWHVASGNLLRAFKSSSSELALSPDGEVLAASSGGTINLWQLETKKLLGTLRGSLYSSLFVAFGAEGRLISGSSDGIRVWRQTVTPLTQQRTLRLATLSDY